MQQENQNALVLIFRLDSACDRVWRCPSSSVYFLEVPQVVEATATNIKRYPKWKKRSTDLLKCAEDRIQIFRCGLKGPLNDFQRQNSYDGFMLFLMPGWYQPFQICRIVTTLPARSYLTRSKGTYMVLLLQKSRFLTRWAVVHSTRWKSHYGELKRNFTQMESEYFYLHKNIIDFLS